MRGAPSPRRARYGSAVLAVVVTALFAYLAVKDVNFAQLRRSLGESNYRWLLPASALLALAFFIRVIRWRFLFARRTRPAVWPTTEALLVGQFLNNVLPLRAGDAARVVSLHSRGGTSRVETVGTVVIERVFDVLALVLLLFVALPWYPQVTWIRAAAALGIVVAVGVVVAILLLRVYGDRPIRFLLRPFVRLPFVSQARLDAAVRNLTQGVIGLRSARLGVAAFVLTLLSWLILGLSFWCIMLGFHLGLSPGAGLLVVIATGLSLVIPSAPAAVGVFEAAAIIVLSAYGIPRSESLSYALVVHAVNVLPFVASGLLLVNLQPGAFGRSSDVFRGADRQIADARLDSSRKESGLGRRDARRSCDEENDVAEPAHRELHVDQL
jgi:glycosyltransferase 2 family protein